MQPHDTVVYTQVIIVGAGSTSLALAAALNGRGIETLTERGRSITHIGQTDRCVHAMLDDGRTLHGRYLICAEGMPDTACRLQGRILFTGATAHATQYGIALADALRIALDSGDERALLEVSPAAVPSRRARVWPLPPVQSSHSHSPAA